MRSVPRGVFVYAQIHQFILNELGFRSEKFYKDPEKLVREEPVLRQR
jgi:hypothetical protein